MMMMMMMGRSGGGCGVGGVEIAFTQDEAADRRGTEMPPEVIVIEDTSEDTGEPSVSTTKEQPSSAVGEVATSSDGLESALEHLMIREGVGPQVGDRPSVSTTNEQPSSAVGEVATLSNGLENLSIDGLPQNTTSGSPVEEHVSREGVDPEVGESIS